MTIVEYREYISAELDVNALDVVYITQKIIFRNEKMIILKKRLKAFFEKDVDINRNINIKKAYVYGYTKTEIANFLNLSTTTINKILIKQGISKV